MSTPFQAQDPNFEARVRDSFARQAAMDTLGATLAEVAPGRVVITLPWAAHLTQQHGFLHAGVARASTAACRRHDAGHSSI